jgi:hypothetical protein
VSDDSVPMALPLLRSAAGSSEVTTLYRELGKPLGSSLSEDVLQTKLNQPWRHRSCSDLSETPATN